MIEQIGQTSNTTKGKRPSEADRDATLSLAATVVALTVALYPDPAISIVEALSPGNGAATVRALLAGYSGLVLLWWLSTGS